MVARNDRAFEQEHAPLLLHLWTWLGVAWEYGTSVCIERGTRGGICSRTRESKKKDERERQIGDSRENDEEKG